MTQYYWDDEAGAYVACEVHWNGTLHRQHEDTHSLLESRGRSQPSNHLMVYAPTKDAYPNMRERNSPQMKAMAGAQFGGRTAREKAAKKGKAA